MEIRISNGGNDKQVRPIGCCDIVCCHNAACLSSIFLQGAYKRTPQLSEIMNLRAVLNNDSQGTSVFHYCSPLKEFDILNML